MDAIINQDALLAFIAAEVKREVAEQLAQTEAAPANPLGIAPDKAYTRKEAAELLDMDPKTLEREEKRRRLKRLKNSYPVRYLGAELHRYRGLL